MMDFDEWCYESNIEEEYSILHSEYGDAMPLLSEYKEQKYEEYKEQFLFSSNSFQKRSRK